jgi:outer membrane protein
MKMVRVLLIAGSAMSLLLGVSPALADQGDWMFRFRLIDIAPDDAGTDQLEDIGVDDDFTFAIDISRFLTENLALEVMAATAAQPITLEGGSIGSVHHLPPTVTLQWHFTPDGDFSPYVGAGLNYTIFYEQTGVLDELDLDDSFGLAGQLGADFKVGSTIFMNVDVKYVNIETDVKVDGTGLGTIEINPWVFGVGFGHRW